MSTATATTAAVLPAARRPARWALVLALLGLPGSTIAWDLPAGGYWIGMPLAFAALIVGAPCLRVPDRQSRTPKPPTRSWTARPPAWRAR